MKLVNPHTDIGMHNRPQSSDTAILITGMHRSGTSCLTGSLQQNGLHLGKVFEWSTYNLKGNRENEQIMQLNDSVLATSGGSWSIPPAESIRWTEQQAKKRDEILSVFVSGSYEIWGFKDPRTIFTLPFWRGGVCNTKLVASFRHPILVAKSLLKRNDMPIEDGLELWKTYNQRLLSYLEEEEFPIISFDMPRSDYSLCIESITERLGIAKHSSYSEEPFLDNGLINATLEDDDDQVPDEVINLYDKLNNSFLAQQRP